MNDPQLGVASYSPPAALLEHLRGCQRPILFSHIHPDGDAVGSEIGLWRGLQSLGKEPRILNAHPAPEKFEFLDPEGAVEVVAPEELEKATAAFAQADLLVIMDTSDPDRLGHLGPIVTGSSLPKVCIDHHLCEDPSPFDVLWSETSSPSTGNLVVPTLAGLGAELDAKAATALFVALATDTGWFRFGNASPVAFQVAAELVAAGAKPDELYRRVYQDSPISRVRLLGELLAGVQSDADGRILHAVVALADLEKHGVAYEELDGYIDSLKAIQGGEIVFLVVELSPGRYKVSLRSQGSVSIHPIAVQFGGGGHAQAAGCRIEGTAAEVTARVVEAARGVLSAT